MNPSRLLSVLVVDDSRPVRARVRRLLEESDSRCVVMEAGSAAEAMKAFEHLRPDLVVLDLSLPDGSGFQLLPKVRQAVPQSTVILLTNHDGAVIRQRALSLGADYFFRKSSEFELVAMVLQRVATRLRPATSEAASCAIPETQ